MAKSSLSLALVALLAASASADNELVEGMTAEDFEMARTFNGFNSTFLLAAIAVGAVLVLLVGVGLYLYDVYSDNSKTDPYPNPDYTAYYADQYQNAEYAYPAAQQSYQRRRYAGVRIPLSKRNCGRAVLRSSKKRIVRYSTTNLSLSLSNY